MRRVLRNQFRKVKVTVLCAAVLGTAYSSACTWGDVGLNIVNGTLSFVKGYTADVWDALVPPPGDLFGE
jgi:hypothetical protein